MSSLEYLFRLSIYVMVAVLLGILISDIGSRRQDEANEPQLVGLEPNTVISPKPVVTAATERLSVVAAPNKEIDYHDRLDRFDALRSKVLLKDGELAQKQRTLAHLKTVQWIEKQLSGVPTNGPDALKDRLTMVDFLEDALTWKENPIRSDVLDSLERTLEANNIKSAPKEIRQMIVGDKIELFNILVEEEPSRARALLESTKDKQLTNIFQYAIKRLSLWKKLGEEAP